jgi:hypothetical protein
VSFAPNEANRREGFAFDQLGYECGSNVPCADQSQLAREIDPEHGRRYTHPMRSPFPGMDPYLEHPALWPDVHNSLIAAIRDEVAPLVAPRYYVGLERRAYLLTPDDVAFIGRPDIALIPRPPYDPPLPTEPAESTVGVLEVDVPMNDRVSESFLEVREVGTGLLVTVLELLSPANKLLGEGREQYEAKRADVLGTRTNLVEVDLLRAGRPLQVVGGPGEGGYRILVSRGWRRPKATLYTFGIQATIPAFPLPLRHGEDEPIVDLNAVLHALYDRARFDLRLDYSQPPVPPLAEADAAWSRGRIGS